MRSRPKGFERLDAREFWAASFTKQRRDRRRAAQAAAPGLIGRKKKSRGWACRWTSCACRSACSRNARAHGEARAEDGERRRTHWRGPLRAGADIHRTQGMLAAIEREESRSTEEKNLAVQEIHSWQRNAPRILIASRNSDPISRTASATKAKHRRWRRISKASCETEATLASCASNAELERDAATWRERVTALGPSAVAVGAVRGEARRIRTRTQPAQR